MMMWWWIIGLGIFILGIALYTGKNKGRMVTKEDESSLEILKKRYAKGEISKEEYQEQRRIINYKI